VVIDDKLPLHPNPSGRYIDQLYNAKMSPDNAWWAVLLEKAYCKMHVNCANTNGGSPLASFRDLTGMPVIKYAVAEQTDQDFYNVIKDVRGN